MKITLVAWGKAGGDGSYSVRLFKDRDALKETVDRDYEGYFTYQELVDQDDPYTTGSVEEITLELDDGGNLINKPSCSWG